MAIEGRITPERGFAAFMNGVLDGFVQGKKMQTERAQETRSAEEHAMALKIQDLAYRKGQAEHAFNLTTQGLQRAKMRAEIAAQNRLGSAEIQNAKLELAQAQADRAAVLLQIEQLKAESAQALSNMTKLFQQMQAQMGTGPAVDTGEEDTGTGIDGVESGLDAGEGVDTRDMPALEPGEEPQGMLPPALETPQRGVVPGGRRVLTGPPREGNIVEEMAADPRTMGKQAPFLPPGVPPVARTIPIQPSEVKKALESENADAAITALITNEGQQFGAEMAKMKKTDPVKYANAMRSEIDKHRKTYSTVYNAYRVPGGGMESELSVRMQNILTDPGVRAWQSPSDTDAAASQAVGELSLEALLKNEKTKLRTYISMDAANNGDIARYNGRLLNQAMDDVFGGRAQYTRFSDDVEYSLRQIIDALYSDEMSATGDAALGFTNPLTPEKASGREHPIMRLLDTYWEPVRALDRRAVERERDKSRAIFRGLPYTGKQ